METQGCVGREIGLAVHTGIKIRSRKDLRKRDLHLSSDLNLSLSLFLSDYAVSCDTCPVLYRLRFCLGSKAFSKGRICFLTKAMIAERLYS